MSPKPKRMHPPPSSHRRRFLGHCAQWLAAGTALPLATPALAALPGARRLALAHTHTLEQIALVYALGDAFVTPALDSLNHFLRDHYSGAVGQMDPQLFHLLHQVQQALGARQPFEVISGYRSPATNATLRSTRAGGVAQHSLHMDGKAIDVRLPGVPLADLRDAARSLRGGGVGFYPREQFVHIDTGRVRHW
jgi:uncharacterized protein YcbK (DUF882 family)